MDGMQNLLSDLILFRLPEGSLPQRLLSSDAAARSELVVPCAGARRERKPVLARL